MARLASRKNISGFHTERGYRRNNVLISRLKTFAWSLFLLALCYRLGNPAPQSQDLIVSTPPKLRSANPRVGPPPLVDSRVAEDSKAGDPENEDAAGKPSDRQGKSKSEAFLTKDENQKSSSDEKVSSNDKLETDDKDETTTDKPNESKAEANPSNDEIIESKDKPETEDKDENRVDNEDESKVEASASKDAHQESSAVKKADSMDKLEADVNEVKITDKQERSKAEVDPFKDEDKKFSAHEKVDIKDKLEPDENEAKTNDERENTEAKADPSKDGEQNSSGDQKVDSKDKPEIYDTNEKISDKEDESKADLATKSIADEKGDSRHKPESKLKTDATIGRQEGSQLDVNHSKDGDKRAVADRKEDDNKSEPYNEQPEQTSEKSEEKTAQKEGAEEAEEIPNGLWLTVLRPAELADWDYFPVVEKQSVKDPELNLDHTKCSSLAIDNSPPSRRPPSDGACEGYDGVLHIQHGDSGGASGTIFFQYMVGHLQWAEQHNFLPWVHMNDFSKPVFDEIVHTKGPNTEVTLMGGKEVGWALDKRDPLGYAFPGKVLFQDGVTEIYPKTYSFSGTGVWNHYFEPVSHFSPGDPSCTDKPYVTMDDYHISPGLHAHAPWAPRAWRYWLPDYIRRSNVSLREWFEPQRRQAAATTKRYIRFNEDLEQRAACALPNPENSLGVHIRHGNKWVSRGVLSVSEFLPYCEAFVDNGGGSIYLATDSALVFDEIMREWPDRVKSHVVRQQSVKGLSRNGTASFDLGVSTHRTNIEALTDGLALSKCTYLLHGLSALTEAAFYLNHGLVERSVNLERELLGSARGEDEERLDVQCFVNEILPLGRTNQANESESSSERSQPVEATLDEPSSTQEAGSIEEQDEPSNKWTIPNEGYTDLSLLPADWEYFPNIKELSVKEPALTLDPKKCSSLVLNNSSPRRRPPSKGACDGYDGIVHIKHGDTGGASGTIFFQLMVGMLQWADQHNFKPWVHLNDVSWPIFDKKVHTQGLEIEMTMLHGMEIGFTRDKSDPLGYIFPGKPQMKLGHNETYRETYYFQGTGVWNHYFEPVSDFSPEDLSCINKPLVTFEYMHVMPGTHSQAPYAPHGWRYWMPEYIQKPNISLQEWFKPQRKHAAAVTKRYIRFNAAMEQRAACAHPITKNSLGVHIRHGDKWSSRVIIPVSEYKPYCEAFVDNGGGAIFLATDSGLVVDDIMREWPAKVTSRIVRQAAMQGLSRNESAAFDLGVSIHRTNVEALVDGLAMSKCTYLLHGLSALSEAAFFMNYGLSERAVNLEDDDVPSVEYFVDYILPRGRSSYEDGRSESLN